jgi:cold shock CspA family protein
MFGRIKSVRPLRQATAKDCASRNSAQSGRLVNPGDMLDGYGFISGQDGIDYYFHRTALLELELTETLLGLWAEFDPAYHGKGPRAINVRIVAGLPQDLAGSSTKTA